MLNSIKAFWDYSHEELTAMAKNDMRHFEYLCRIERDRLIESVLHKKKRIALKSYSKGLTLKISIGHSEKICSSDDVKIFWNYSHEELSIMAKKNVRQFEYLFQAERDSLIENVLNKKKRTALISYSKVLTLKISNSHPESELYF